MDPLGHDGPEVLREGGGLVEHGPEVATGEGGGERGSGVEEEVHSEPFWAIGPTEVT